MIDLFNIPKGLGNIQMFPGFSSGNGTEWQTWTRPRGTSMALIICISGGGAGGNGFSAAAGNPRGGGGGGGGSGWCRIIVPTILLPNTLYVSAGTGGVPGSTVGRISYVSVRPSIDVLDLICQSNLAAPTGGTDGTASAAGVGGLGGTAVTAGNINLCGLGIFISGTGQNGSAGGAHTGANGANVALAITNSQLCNGGAGGAGTQSADFTGGVNIAVTDSIVSNSRPMDTGSSGHVLRTPFYLFGGLGGNSFDASAGIPGGYGSYGAGGGGGGGGTTGGLGGAGGAGLVMIFAW